VFLRHFRPIILGTLLFILLNVGLSTIFILKPAIHERLDLLYGNFLPVKLQQLKAQANRPIDVLFLGTSQTNNGFATQAFEEASPVKLSSFNMGLPSNRYDVMLTYLQAHIRHYGKPKLLLLEMNPTFLDKETSLYYLPALFYRTLLDHDPQSLDLVMTNPHMPENVRHELLLSVSSLHEYRATFSPLHLISKVADKISDITHRYTKTALAQEDANTDNLANKPAETLLGAKKASLPGSFPVSLPMKEKGWNPLDIKPSMLSKTGLVQASREADQYFLSQMPPVYFGKIQAILDYCHQQNIPVMLVRWPDHPGFRALFAKTGQQAPFEQGLQHLLQAEQVSYFDLNQNLPSQLESTFSDPRHLTPAAAVSFSKLLAQKIFNQPGIEDLFQDKQKL
jgi:hypothetical protein